MKFSNFRFLTKVPKWNKLKGDLKSSVPHVKFDDKTIGDGLKCHICFLHPKLWVFGSKITYFLVKTVKNEVVILSVRCTGFDVFFYAESIGDGLKALKRPLHSYFTKTLKKCKIWFVRFSLRFCNFGFEFGDEIWNTAWQFRIESVLKIAGWLDITFLGFEWKRPQKLLKFVKNANKECTPCT